MTIERKSYSVADLKVADDQLGVIEAIVSVFSNVDHGNEKVMPGFFSKSIQKKLPKGVWAHDWKQPIAKTLEAKELLPGDPLLPDSLKLLGGAYIKGQFNLDTQRGKEAYSDIKFGIVDEFSIGYQVLKDGKDKETGARELIEGDWKEWSPVLVGMNDQTRLISIKSEEAKGMLAEEMAQTTPSTWEIQSAFCRVVCKIAESAKNAMTLGDSFDWRAKVTELVSEYGPKIQPVIIAQIEEFLSGTDDEFYLKGISESESFESFESAETAIKKFAQKMRSNHENRTKEGRMLSTTNRSTVQGWRDDLAAIVTDLDGLLSASEPKPKEKEIDVDALRTQSLRARSTALLAGVA
jgi:HK97 family phage prohead protease